MSSVRQTFALTSYSYPLDEIELNLACSYNGFASSRPSVGLSVRLHYRVRSINSIPIEGFSSNVAAMFTLSMGCAEPMVPLCHLNVKVTIEGHISNNQILDIMSCPLCKSYTN